jgi:hypothetical protein
MDKDIYIPVSARIERAGPPTVSVEAAEKGLDAKTVVAP